MMLTTQIVALLIAERDKLNRAIQALSSEKRRGRPPKNAVALAAPAAAPKRKGRTFTAEQREAARQRMHKMWAKRRKAAKTA